MNISKEYWIWEEDFNTTEFKLGSRIDELIDKKLIFKQSDGTNQYQGHNGYPYGITVQENWIITVFFKEKLMPIFVDDPINWDEKAEVIVNNINKKLTACLESEQGPKLVVVFRDSYVALIGLLL